MRKRSLVNLIFGAMGLLSVSSCQDYDANFSPEAMLKQEYADQFEKVFGKVDPNHDWSMAATIKMNVTVGNTPNVIIYSDKPGYSGVKTLGIVNGKNGQFNVVKGTEQVYAIVNENGKQLVAGYFDVIDGVVNISNQPTGMRKATTRSGEGLSVGTKLFTHIAYDPTVYEWDGITLRLNGAQFIKYENSTYYLSYNNTFEGPYYEITHHVGTKVVNEYYSEPYDYWSYDGGEDVEWNLGADKTVDNVMKSFELYEDGSPKYYESEAYNNSGLRKYESKKHYDAEYHLINGNTLASTKAEWKIGDCKDLFWSDDPYAFFREGKDYRCDDKKALYEGQGVSLAEVEAGVVYTTKNEGDPISIPMMYGCTERGNILGYYYYTDDQDPRTVNRYVLYEDAQPQNNIWVDNKALHDGMYLQQMQDGWTDESVVTCNVRKLVYFGENGDEAGRFEFPANLHIGFFIMRQHSPAADAPEGTTGYESLNGATCETGWAYSDPSLCEKYFYDQNGLNGTLNENWSYWVSTIKSEDKNRGKVKALTWKYGDRILVGFGDQSGDNDLNDFVFWVDGNFKEEPKIKITTEETFTGNSWLFACEDLGGSFDYDFNDVVWEVAQSIKEITTTQEGQDPVTTYEYGDVKVRLMAAGGTLPFTLKYNGTTVCTKESAFGAGISNTVLIKPKPSSWYTIISNPEEEVDINELKEQFSVIVEGNDGDSHIIETPQADTPYEGSNGAPEILLLPGDWAWPTELTCIKDAYKDFTNWTYDKNMTGWTNSKQAGKTVTR